ncbi:MAG TPA: malonic semialdehyde reductase [Gammaproteobacteria bacterium]|jgi:3-hydroxypropanoate dehydrogenase|nr:malonic semialdehyde reductase [Gammaproteobacteria bacterium]HIP10295.1 malonic semialdehyde reductase [Rhodospirillales bacterium]
MTFDAKDLAAQESFRRLKEEVSRADPATLRLILTEARTQNVWQERDVSNDTLEEIYQIMKMGPTSANCCPARIVFLKSQPGKERLRAALKPNNIDKTMSAPVTAIIAYDTAFWKHAETMFPQNPGAQLTFKDNPTGSGIAAFRNGSLQGAYFLIAARAVGLDCGPMSGFDNALVDDEFFPDTTLKSNFLCNLGYGDASKTFKRLPRFDFDEVCEIL